MINEKQVIEGIGPGKRVTWCTCRCATASSCWSLVFPQGRPVTPLPPRMEKPLVFYGTSITQGIRIQGVELQGTAVVEGEDRELSVVGGAIEDDFEPYSVHIYRFDGAE